MNVSGVGEGAIYIYADAERGSVVIMMGMRFKLIGRETMWKDAGV